VTTAKVLSIWITLPVSLLLILGGILILVGALGLMRLPNFYQRIHGPAITVTLGAGCVLLASMIYFTALQARPVIHELAISAFILMTTPVVAMLIMRAAVYRDLRAGRSRSKTEFGKAYRYPQEEDDTKPH
jgi:multicomponent K+:H+ antiporter subunit G|tara:strand:- start:36439 stop:36831 length:393 start_codon:yes stop_codon:yes gene_type:complete